MSLQEGLDLVRQGLSSMPPSPETKHHALAEVAHYTSMATLPKLVWGGAWRSIWSTSVRFMNDREEFSIGARAILDLHGPKVGSVRIDPSAIPYDPS